MFTYILTFVKLLLLHVFVRRSIRWNSYTQLQFRTNIPNLWFYYAKIENYLQKISYLPIKIPPPEKVANHLIINV